MIQFFAFLFIVLLVIKLTVPGAMLAWWVVFLPLIPVALVVLSGLYAVYMFFSGRVFSTKGLYKFAIEWKWDTESDSEWKPVIKDNGKPMIEKTAVKAADRIHALRKTASSYVDYRYQRV